MLAVLASGEVVITGGGGDGITAQVSGGFFSVDHDTVTIVAESVEVGAGAGGR